MYKQLAIGAGMIAVTALIVLAGSARAEVVHSARRFVCKTQEGVKAVFDAGEADSSITMREAVASVNAKLNDECTFADTFYEKREKVGEVRHGGSTFDVYRIAIMNEAVAIGEAFTCFRHIDDGSI